MRDVTTLQAAAVPALRPMSFTVYAIEDGRTAEEAELPEPFASRLNEVYDAVDCYGGCWICGDAIGWVLHEDDDNPNNSGVRWHAVYLVREDDGPVSPVCEVCAPQSPGTPYPRPTVASGGAWTGIEHLPEVGSEKYKARDYS